MSNINRYRLVRYVTGELATNANGESTLNYLKTPWHAVDFMPGDTVYWSVSNTFPARVDPRRITDNRFIWRPSAHKKPM
jgi:hypothetical protein